MSADPAPAAAGMLGDPPPAAGGGVLDTAGPALDTAGPALDTAGPALDTAGPALYPGLTRDWRVSFVLDVPLTLSVHRRGGADPAYRVDAVGAVWRTSLTPDGPGTLRILARPASAASALAPVPGSAAAPVPGSAAAPVPGSPLTLLPGSAGTQVTGQAWGPGAGWLLDTLPAQLGFHDDRSGFTARHPVVSELALRYAGLRVGRTGRVFEALVPAVLEQKVVGREARRAWRYLLGKFGLPAPGPALAGMRVCPPPWTWARIPSWDWHQAGVEGVRARTIIAAAEMAARLEELADLGLGSAEADRRLRSLHGIGPWTSAEVRQRAMGDPDAVSVGDYHLPRVVGWALARRITDDDGMLELLAPYAGHRYRVTRLIELGGGGPPRRGPRMPVRDYRGF